jgi:hypothetical protein
MFSKMLKYLVIFLCGYILIKWVSINHPFVLADFFMSLVINPLKFFAASLVFFIGFLLTGHVIRELIHRTREVGKKRKAWDAGLIFEYLCFFFIFSVLIYFSWEQTLVFFSLSLFYGMISIEL